MADVSNRVKNDLPHPFEENLEHVQPVPSGGTHTLFKLPEQLLAAQNGLFDVEP